MKLQVRYFTRVFVLMCTLFFVRAMHGAPVLPGQNLWVVEQQTAQAVEAITESISIFDTVLISQADVVSSFIDQGCDFTSITEELAGIASVVEKIDTNIENLSASGLDEAASLIEDLTVIATDVTYTMSLIEQGSTQARADISALDVALQEHNASMAVQLMGISAQVSVVDSKVDKLSNSLFPVLAPLATANAVLVVDSKVDKLSNSLFPVLATLATAQGVSMLATSAQVSVVDSKVDKLSNSLFPVLATLATSASITPVATGAQVSVVDSKVDTLSNSVFPVLATILADVSFPTPMTTSMTITTSGSYRLAKNIVGNITINADAVTLDLNGFTITTAGAVGVSIATGHRYIMVKNGFITGGTTGISVATNNSDFVISDIEIADAGGGIELVATNTFSSTIKNFTVKNCAVFNAATAYHFENCINGEINNCVAQGATSTGFSISSACVDLVFNDCIVQKITGLGFSVVSAANCIFNGCKAVAGTSTGFVFSTCTNCTVMSCIALKNISDGFNVSGGSNNIFVNNFASRNGVNYSIGATPDAPLTSSTDTTMNFWKNYQE